MKKQNDVQGVPASPSLTTPVASLRPSDQGAPIANAPAHTPLPWERVNEKDIFTTNGATNADGLACAINDGWQIADCAVGTTNVDGDPSELSISEQCANAEFIVRACNSHYELLSALVGVMQEIEHCVEDGSLSGPAVATNIHCNRARAAIAKATQP